MAVPPPLDPALPGPAPPDPAKPALRTALRAARRRFVDGLGARPAAEAAIRDRLRPLLSRPGPLAGYVAMRGEPDVMPLLDAAARAGHAVALPHVPATRTMSFAAWHPDMELARGPLGIAQPAEPGDAIPAVLLVPLLGFDRRGARLGQGGGYYDRWLAAHPQALRIGVAWSVQEVARLPVDAWDVPLHGVVTEQDWIAM